MQQWSKVTGFFTERLYDSLREAEGDVKFEGNEVTNLPFTPVLHTTFPPPNLSTNAYLL